ncbi:MAG TPA: hypothetical protein VFV96_10230 [Verrucomicrobiae bacterium]|nr:hypothetical protein [Verrucomicrobiae bacterium]
MNKLNKLICLGAAALFLSALATNVMAEGKADAKAKPAYPLTTCVVSGEKLDDMGKPYVFDYKGHEVRLCCKKCLKKFDKDPEAYLKKIEAANVKK